MSTKNSTLPVPSPRSCRRENGAPSGWERYRDLLARKRVPRTAQRWYVHHVEDFLKEIKPLSLSQLTAPRVIEYFRQASRNTQWKDWQFRQVVDALRLLLVDLARADCAKDIDWDYWLEASKSLAPNHPTIGKEQPPEATVLRKTSGPVFKASVEANATLIKLARTIRAKQYSIRWDVWMVSSHS